MCHSDESKVKSLSVQYVYFIDESFSLFVYLSVLDESTCISLLRFILIPPSRKSLAQHPAVPRLLDGRVAGHCTQFTNRCHASLASQLTVQNVSHLHGIQGDPLGGLSCSKSKRDAKAEPGKLAFDGGVLRGKRCWFLCIPKLREIGMNWL